MSAFSNFWRETGSKVARHQKTRAQAWFMRHPTTFLVTWGTKALVWNVPKATIRGGRNIVRRRTGKPLLKKKATTSTAVETITTVMTGPSGATWTSTTTTERERPKADATDNVIDLGERRDSKRGRNVGAPIERGHTMESGRALLGGTALGRGFLALAAEFDAFTPVRGQEATSTLNLTTDANKAFTMVALGVDELSDTIAACDLDRRVVNGLYRAVEGSESIAVATRRARRRIETYYAGQLDQESSGARTVQALPAARFVGDEAAGIIPASTLIGAEYEEFEPEPDAEATSILECIKLSQAGFALVAASLEDLARRMAQHNIDRRVRDLIRAAADEATSTAVQFRAAKRTMTSLYRGQMDQESSGHGTMRTAPVRRIS